MANESVTVLITDMEGSTAYAASQGDEAAMDIVRTHERLVGSVLGAHQGRTIKSMGDGFMIAFDTAAAGVACALEIQKVLAEHNATNPDGQIHVRMGLNVGPVIEEGGDLYGTTVNAASRIAAKARSGQVLLSEEVRTLAEPHVECTFLDHGLFWLKGLQERWRLHEATTDPAASAARSRSDGSTPFVDRDDERAELRRHVDAAMDGRGSFVLLSGDPGAGKTRLAEEIGAEAEGRGMRVVVGRSYEAGRDQPFAPIIDILDKIEKDLSPMQFRVLLGEAAGEIARLLPHIRRRYPDLPPPAELPADQVQRYLFSSIRDVLATLGRDRPLVLILDDIHWADETSLLFLQQLAPDLGDLPILILATRLVTERPGPLDRLLDSLQRRHVIERVAVGALREADVGEILAALAPDPPASIVRVLHAETEGNPFFLEEVLRHLDEHSSLLDEEGRWPSEGASLRLEVPDTVRLTVRRRLDLLSETTKRILTSAAMIGRAFGFDLLGEISEVDEDTLLDSLDEAERAGIVTSTVRAGAVEVRFSHELVRQTLMSDVSLPRRQLLHLRIADAIESVHAGKLDDHAASIAYHLTEAGARADRQRSARFLVMAGARALDAAAYEEAFRHLTQALRLLAEDDHSGRGRCLELLGRAERSLGRLDDALSTWNQALASYTSANEPSSVAALCLDAGIQVAWWRRGREVMRLIDRGLEAVGDHRTAERGGLLALAGAMASARGETATAEKLLGEALEVARETGDERVLGIALYSNATHHFNYSQYEQAIQYGEEGIRYLRAAGDLWSLANLLGYLSASNTWLGRTERAFEIGEEAEPLSLRIGNWSAYVFAHRAITHRNFHSDPDLDFYANDGREAIELGRRHSFDWVEALGYTRLALAYFWRGEWEEAVAQLEQAVGMNIGGANSGYTSLLQVIHAYLGNRELVLELYQRVRAERAVAGRSNTTTAWTIAYMAIEAHAVLGLDEVVVELAPVVRSAVERGIIARGLDYRLLRTLAGIAATCTQDWDQAEEDFTIALHQSRTSPVRLEEPDAQRFFAWMLLRRRRPADIDRARGLLGEAISNYSRIGMKRHEQLAREMLDQIA